MCVFLSVCVCVYVRVRFRGFFWSADMLLSRAYRALLRMHVFVRRALLRLHLCVYKVLSTLHVYVHRTLLRMHAYVYTGLFMCVESVNSKNGERRRALGKGYDRMIVIDSLRERACARERERGSERERERASAKRSFVVKTCEREQMCVREKE